MVARRPPGRGERRCPREPGGGGARRHDRPVPIAAAGARRLRSTPACSISTTMRCRGLNDLEGYCGETSSRLLSSSSSMILADGSGSRHCPMPPATPGSPTRSPGFCGPFRGMRDAAKSSPPQRRADRATVSWREDIVSGRWRTCARGVRFPPRCPALILPPALLDQPGKAVARDGPGSGFVPPSVRSRSSSLYLVGDGAAPTTTRSARPSRCRNGAASGRFGAAAFDGKSWSGSTRSSSRRWPMAATAIAMKPRSLMAVIAMCPLSHRLRTATKSPGTGPGTHAASTAFAGATQATQTARSTCGEQNRSGQGRRGRRRGPCAERRRKRRSR